MSYTVELTHSAAADLNDIVEWIARNDSLESALHVLGQIQARIDSLSLQPERGLVPPQLRILGTGKYQEVFFKPYCIVHHIREQRVIVNLIADGRREMSELLQRRLTMATGW